MKVMFGAQGSILRVFHNLDQHLRKSGRVEESAYLVSDSDFFFKNKEELPLIRDGAAQLLFEWDFTLRPDKLTGNPHALEVLEKEYGEPFLWNAVIADRRLMYGPTCKVRQDYSGKFSHAELCEIVYRALKRLDEFFDSFKPDCVINHVPATFAGYLLYLVSKRRGVPYLNLKSTKIKNYVTFSESVHEKPQHIYKRYFENMDAGSAFVLEQEAKAYLLQAAAAPVQYEGSGIRTAKRNFEGFKKAAIGFLGAVRSSWKRRHPIIGNDNHNPPPWGTYLHGNLLKGHRGRQSLNIMKRRMKSIEELGQEKFVFYPLHAEPEITLSVYGRDHQNQVETIRRIAQSLPIGFKLVIKEHPRSLSYHSPSYYKKILEIPNVYFIDPQIRPFSIIQAAQAVIVISGFVGFEALVIGKPVIALGDVFYNVLPESMIRSVKSMSDFQVVFKDLIRDYCKDENALVAFIAASMSQSVDVNLYSDLLKKAGRVSFGGDPADDQIKRLADYFLKRYADVVSGNVEDIILRRKAEAARP